MRAGSAIENAWLRFGDTVQGSFDCAGLRFACPRSAQDDIFGERERRFGSLLSCMRAGSVIENAWLRFGDTMGLQGSFDCAGLRFACPAPLRMTFLGKAIGPFESSVGRACVPASRECISAIAPNVGLQGSFDCAGLRFACPAPLRMTFLGKAASSCARADSRGRLSPHVHLPVVPNVHLCLLG